MLNYDKIFKKGLITLVAVLIALILFGVGIYFFSGFPRTMVNTNNINFSKNIGDLSWLSTSGNNIVDKKGEKVFLKGVNFGNWLLWEGCAYGILNCAGWPEKKLRAEMEKRMPEEKVDKFFDDIVSNYILPQDFQNVKNNGLNFVRLGFHYRYVKENELTVLDEAVQWAKEAGVYVILNMHAAPGAQAPAYFADSEGEILLWKEESYRQEYYRLWEILAERYRDEPAVAGYEDLNEPDAEDGSQVTALYNNVIKKIRQIDNKHIIFLDGNHYAGDFSIFPEPLDPNAVYVFHDYIETLDGLRTNIGRQGYSAFSLKYNVPLMCNEFSIWQLPLFADFFLQNNINYAPWSYKGWDNPPPYVFFDKNNAWRQWIEELNKNHPTDFTKTTLHQMANIVNASNLSDAAKADTLSIINGSSELSTKKEDLAILPKKYPGETNEFLAIRLEFSEIGKNAETAWLDGFTQSIMAMPTEEYNSLMLALRTN